MTASTFEKYPPVESDAQRRESRPARAVLIAVAGALLIAGLTTLVVLTRAGGLNTDPANWLVQWELRSSDNGVLFQVMQDVVARRPLDWSFSPQVFVFPELPISAAAFGLAGGSVYGYYVIVAILNNVLLFVVLWGLVRVFFPASPATASTVRALVAMTPLLVLPLIGTSWIFSFHLAPTYYFGEYLALLAAPILLLAPTRRVRIAVGIVLALTLASNPLTAVFAFVGVAAVVVLRLVRTGWRATLPSALWIGGVLVVALTVRLAFFGGLQGTSPFTYVNPEVFARRLSEIGPYYAYQARDPAAHVVLVIGVVLAVVALLGAVAASVRYLQRRRPADSRLLAGVYLGLVPLGGLAATAALMITHYLYFWPLLVLPLILTMLAVPRVALPSFAAAGGATLVAVALATGVTTNLAHLDGYVGYRNAETRCLDGLPGAPTLGYATFSDARRLSLTSERGVRLIQLNTDANPNLWLTNRSYARTEAGTFFYINDRGDELPIDMQPIVDAAGVPDELVDCGDGQRVLLYTDPAKKAAIATFYGLP
ncbi:hypothetical protein BH11ACT3_BH11ACT3_11220 [soil metagenome]